MSEEQDAVERAVRDFRAGRAVVLVPDSTTPGDGSLIFSAELASPELVAFAVRHSPGNISVAITPEDALRLDVPIPAQAEAEMQNGVAGVTVNAAEGFDRGLSARERATTIRLLADLTSSPQTFTRPGHVAAVSASPGGVLTRRGTAEAAVDVARLAGLRPAGVYCDLVSAADPLGLASPSELRVFAQEHQLVTLTLGALVTHRYGSEVHVRRITAARAPLRYGDFTAVGYVSRQDKREHIALIAGEIGDGEDLLVYVHGECLTGDIFRSLRCNCASNLEAALVRVAEAGRGVVVYVRGKEGNAAGLLDTLRGYGAEDSAGQRPQGEAGYHHWTPNLPDFSTSAQILADLGVRSIRVLRDRPLEQSGAQGFDVRVLGQVPLLGPV